MDGQGAGAQQPLLADGGAQSSPFGSLSLGPLAVQPSKRCSRRLCTGLLLLACLLGILWRYWVFFFFARGYQWDYFVWCQLHPLFLESCPPRDLEVPYHGCRREIGSQPMPRLLLTADGLASPRAEAAFKKLLEDVTVPGVAEKTVLYVIDAAYRSHYDLSPQFTRPPQEYCKLRSGELKALGADEVLCLLLDPSARAHEARGGGLKRRRHGASKDAQAFAEHMGNLTDDAIVDALLNASAIFVEGGNAFFLTASLRRQVPVEPGEEPMSFEDIVRSRVFNDSDARMAYIGVSAGSIVAGADVRVAEPAKWWHLLDGNWTGLSLVPNCSFVPHVTAKASYWLQTFALHHRTGVMGIPQCQPLQEASDGHLSYVCPW